MEVLYSFSPIELSMDFKFVGETFSLGSNKVKTGRGKRLYEQYIVSQGYDEDAVELINKAKYVYSHGLRKNITLTKTQVIVLRLLVKYCKEL